MDIGIKEVDGNASHDRTEDGRRFIFFNEDKATLFYSGMEKLHRWEELSIEEKKAVNSYSHENVHNRQKENWEISIKNRKGKLNYVISEALTELIGRKHTLDYFCEVNKNINRKDLENRLNEHGAYNPAANYLNEYLKSLNKKDIFNEIEEKLKTIDHNKVVDNLLDIINNNKGQDYKLKETDLAKIIKGERYNE